MNKSTEQTQQNPPLTEESFKQIITETMTKSYRKGFNDGLDAVVQLLDPYSCDVQSEQLKELFNIVTKSVKALKLAEEDING